MRARLPVLLVAMLMSLPVLARAQASGTGSVLGKVADTSGGILPGVTVTLKSPEALGTFISVSDAQGLYRLNNLPPATYEARAELQGFQTSLQTVTVRLGAVAALDFALSVGAMNETVTVTSEGSTVDPERTGLAVNINNAALTSLPVSTQRRYQDIWALVPGVFVRPDQSDINPSVNSRGTSENSTKLDGMDITDPFGGGVFSASFNYDAIQDIQVKTLGAEAEDGGRTGGFMTIVTKSGSNSLHGSAALFVIPESFNDSNVSGVAANQRQDVQPDLTLGGPVMRDKVWFFGAYRRIQEDQTLNNAPVARERRGNQIYVKTTAQLSPNHRLQGSVQYDKTRAGNAVIRSSAVGATSATGGLSGATPQQVVPEAFGDLVTGGPLLGVNYTWVVRSNQLFQFIGSWMVNKPQNAEPSNDFGVTKVIQTNAADNIAGSLTTISQEGSLGVVDTSDRSMLYLYPSYSIAVKGWGEHDFKMGAELYPFLRNKTRRDISPLEFYFRPPGTSGSAADVLFERDTFRTNGSGTQVNNEARETIYGFYFQDRWKPTSQVSVKAGFRVDSNRIYTKDRRTGPRPRRSRPGSRRSPPTRNSTRRRSLRMPAWHGTSAAWASCAAPPAATTSGSILAAATAPRTRRMSLPRTSRAPRRGPWPRCSTRCCPAPSRSESTTGSTTRRPTPTSSAPAGRSSCRTPAPPASHSSSSGPLTSRVRTTRTSFAIRRPARFSAGRFRTTTRCCAPTRRTTPSSSSARSSSSTPRTSRRAGASTPTTGTPSTSRSCRRSTRRATPSSTSASPRTS